MIKCEENVWVGPDSGKPDLCGNEVSSPRYQKQDRETDACEEQRNSFHQSSIHISQSMSILCRGVFWKYHNTKQGTNGRANRINSAARSSVEISNSKIDGDNNEKTDEDDALPHIRERKCVTGNAEQ